MSLKAHVLTGLQLGGTINKYLEYEGARLISSQLDGLWGKWRAIRGWRSLDPSLKFLSID